MTSSARHDDIILLLSKASEGVLQEDETQQLADLLRESPSARESYYAFVLLETGLRWESQHSEPEVAKLLTAIMPVGDPGAGSDVSARTDKRVTTSRSFMKWASRHPKVPSIAVAVIGIAALLIVAAITPVSNFLADNSDTTNRDEPAPAAAQEIATLTGWHRIDWREGYHISGQDHRLRAGQRVAMLSGLAEITYDTGAKVVLEGPVEFIVGGSKDEGDDSTRSGRSVASEQSQFVLPPVRNSGYLVQGKLVARVDTPEAKLFTVVTPVASVVDLGTEFGVEVMKSGAADVVVIAGAVEVVREASDGQQAQRVRLTKRQGAFVEPGAKTIAKRDHVDATRISEFNRRIQVVDRFVVPANITASSTYAGSSPMHLSNDTGLTHAGARAKIASKSGEWTGLWAAASGAPATVTFDFGADVSIDHVIVWNYNHTNDAARDNSIRDFTLSFATEAEGIEGIGASLTSTSNFTAAKATNSDAEPGQVFRFPQITARYVRVNIARNYHGPFVGANEIKFGTVVRQDDADKPLVENDSSE